MNRLLILVVCALFLAPSRADKPDEDVPLYEHPEDVRFITSDINLFWDMYDAELPLYTPKELTDQYFKAGTSALSKFYEEKIQSPQVLTTMLNSWLHRQYFEDIRPNTRSIYRQKGRVMRALNDFKKLYPKAVFTDVVFVIGALNTGGVVLRNGQIVIAAEMYSKTEDTETEYLSTWQQSVLQKPDYLPVVILHEFVHLQQQQYSRKNNFPIGGRTLLDRALLEGSADFITHLVLNESLTSELLAYGDTREQQLWKQFKQKMNRSDFGKWLYSGQASGDQPADLGYYIGFKIAQKFYNEASNKKQAVKDIIQMKSGKQLLEKSGYANSFD